MSLRGYIKKSKPALWLDAFPSKASELEKKLTSEWDLRPAIITFGKTTATVRWLKKPRRRIRPRTRQRAAAEAQYRKKAETFIAGLNALGETCPVVAAIPELREGRKYGHPISNRITEVHHLRGRRNSLLLDDRHWMGCSRLGHRFIHQHPEIARAHGWLCAAGLWNVPDQTPVAVHPDFHKDRNARC